VSPILVRPVREQFEHDRVIRLLQAKSRRKYDAGINPGGEQNVAIGTGPSAMYPDVILASLDRGRKVQAIVEVETGESVNRLEALAEWANFARLRPPFHLYVPSSMVEVARQLCDDNHIVVTEIWSYHLLGDDVRFALVHRARAVAAPARRSSPRRSAASQTVPATRRKAKPKTARLAKSTPPRRKTAKTSTRTKQPKRRG
jgi:hypothetical protein